MRSNRQRATTAPSLPTPIHHHRRDSDVSLCSSRPSSAGGTNRGGAPPTTTTSLLITDRSTQSSVLRTINSFLSSHSAPFSLKPPLPSARDITDTLSFLLNLLHFPHDPKHLPDDLFSILKHLNCPIKFNKSALKAPGTPHSWPALISVIYWLVQLAAYAQRPTPPQEEDSSSNDLLSFICQSYTLYLSGEDDAIEELDREYKSKAEHQAANMASAVDARADEAAQLQAKLDGMKNGGSRREVLEKEKAVLMEDVKKFQAVVDSWGGKVADMERAVRDWENELEAKEMDSKRLCDENEELLRRIEGQAVNVRDADRMKRELQAVERDIAEAESGRNALEEKAWALEAEFDRKVKEIVGLTEQCNQAARKLKLGNDLQYVLNAKGSSLIEVMGIDYKKTFKPALAALSEDTKKLSVSKLEELISLQQQSRENATMLEEKRDCLATLQAKVDEIEGWLSSVKKEMEEHATSCTAEAEKVKEDFKRKEHQLSLVENEAQEFLKNSGQNLQDAIRETAEETQICASELLALIDEVSEYKEYMESTMSGLKKDATEIPKFLGEAYKTSAVSSKMDFGGPNLSLKRARDTISA